MSNKILLSEYDENWPRIFESESKKIVETLGDNFIQIHHVGSTSVYGLCAKPKIDIIVVVHDPVIAKGQLESINITYKGEYNIPLHYGFSKRGDINLNIHVYEENHPEIELNLLFRDYLRSNPIVRDEYADLKKGILSNPNANKMANANFRNYTLEKSSFIKNVIKKTGFNRARITKCNDNSEYEYIRNLIESYNNNDHLILYQGVDIVGYCEIQIENDNKLMVKKFVLDKNFLDLSSEFMFFIKKWLKIKNQKV